MNLGCGLCQVVVGADVEVSGLQNDKFEENLSLYF